MNPTAIAKPNVTERSRFDGNSAAVTWQKIRVSSETGSEELEPGRRTQASGPTDQLYAHCYKIDKTLARKSIMWMRRVLT